MLFEPSIDIKAGDTRVRQIRHERMDALRRSTDRMFAVLMVLQWAGGIVAAMVISPRTWIGTTSTMHLHVWAAVILGGLLTMFPVWLVRTRPGSPITRHVIAVAQMLWSALLIHLTGGRIETHFHVFGSLAFLAFYRDWKVLITATVVVALDHLIRGVWWPQSVFGVFVSSNFRWIEHAAWVLFEDTFLILAVARGHRELTDIAIRQVRLEGEIADRQYAERELERANSELTRYATEMQQFAYTVSHDLKSPLVTICASVDILREDLAAGDSEGVECTLKHIRGGTQRMSRLIEDLLELGRVGQIRDEPVDIDIKALVTEIVESIEAQVEASGAVIRIHDDMPVLRSDRTRIMQVFQNFLTNALNYGEGADGLTVEIGAQRIDGELRYFVRDNGPGIAPEYQERIFGLFQRLNNRKPGTGLGLAIVKRIAEMNGGRTWVESALGQGATFWIAVPAALAAEERHCTQSPAQISTAPNPIRITAESVAG